MLTGRVASDVIPKTADTYDLGNATQTWRAMYLDNDTTDGGAIYFDGGSTEFIKASADGADLQLGGFTGFDIKAGCSIKTFGRYLEAKSTNYTITDTDGVSIIAMTTGASDTTVTLPTASDNTGRVITLKKVDSGAGRALLSEEGTDAIDGFSTLVAPLQYDFITVISTGSTWHVIDRRGTSRWISYTPTISNFGTTPTNVNFQYRAVGSTVEILGEFNPAATPASSIGTITLPNSTTMDFLSGTSNYQIIGIAGHNVNTDQVFYIIGTDTTSVLRFSRVIPAASTNALTAINGDAIVAAGNRISLKASAPITEWRDIA
jgi:hypothetical protein